MPPKIPPKSSIDDIKEINHCIITIVVDCECSDRRIKQNSYSSGSDVQEMLRHQPHFDYVDLYCNDQLVFEGDSQIITDTKERILEEKNSKEIHYEWTTKGFWGLRYEKPIEMDCTSSKKYSNMYVNLNPTTYKFKKIYYYKGNKIYTEKSEIKLKDSYKVDINDIIDGKLLITEHDRSPLTKSLLSFTREVLDSATGSDTSSAKLDALKNAIRKYGEQRPEFVNVILLAATLRAVAIATIFYP